MSTEKLGLPKITGNMAADVVRDLNALADAIDKKAGAADGLAQLGPDGKLSKDSLGIETSEIVSKTELNDLKGEVGNADELSTEVKTSIVAAVNELEQKRAILDQAFTTHKADYEQQMGTAELETTDKTVKGAINEVFTLGNSRKSETVDALLSVDDSLPITENDSWQDVINAIGQISTGKKWATGTVGGSTTALSFRYLDNSNGSSRSVTVTGLDFKPSIIFVSLISSTVPNYGTIYFEDFQPLPTYTEPQIFTMRLPIRQQNNTTHFGYKLQSPAEVNSEGFTLPVESIGEHKWIAIE